MWVVLNPYISSIVTHTTIRVPIMLLGWNLIPLRVFGYEDSIDVHRRALSVESYLHLVPLTHLVGLRPNL